MRCPDCQCAGPKSGIDLPGGLEPAEEWGQRLHFRFRSCCGYQRVETHRDFEVQLVRDTRTRRCVTDAGYPRLTEKALPDCFWQLVQ